MTRVTWIPFYSSIQHAYREDSARSVGGGAERRYTFPAELQRPGRGCRRCERILGVELEVEQKERWSHPEPGFYDHPTLGSVAFESAESCRVAGPREPKRGWWWYGQRETRGPFETAFEARDNAEAWGS